MIRRACLGVPALLAGLALASASYADALFAVVRVGDGSAALTADAQPVFIQYMTSAGLVVHTIALPTDTTGADYPLTLSGTNGSEGRLDRSEDKRFITLAGYATPPGTASVATTASTTVNRVVARIDYNDVIDTQTRFTGAFDGGIVRGATTSDGSQIYAAGAPGATDGGVYYAAFGSVTAGTPVTTQPVNARGVGIHNGQLYATSNTSGYTDVFAIGSGLPTAAAAPAPLPGFPTTGASPNEFTFNSAQNLCYVADDRSLALGGGVQEWILNGSTWSLYQTYTAGLPAGVRGLCVDFTVVPPRVYCTTASNQNNAIYVFADSGQAVPTASLVAAAPANTGFRGLARIPVATAGVSPSDAPAAIHLAACPNPSAGSMLLRYALPVAGHVTLRLYDTQGRLVVSPVDAFETAGEHAVRLDTRVLPRGVYFGTLRTPVGSANAKLLVLDPVGAR